ncbi:MAG: HAMP domain-containing histidine kinase [Acidobacteriota bacterium]|nr:HAMP domain-containing histidine kinase [Acidobacteriota bacterium]
MKGRMVKLRLRTKFLLSMLLISAGLTAFSLLSVRHTVKQQVRKEIVADLHNSVTTFQNFHHEREVTLSHSADLLSNMPYLRSLMTTQHEATIQDASGDWWHLAGSDLFLLANRSGTVVALHTASADFTRAMAQRSLNDSMGAQEQALWWFSSPHLYQVFLKPIYFGPAAENRLLGYLVIGYEIDDNVASQVSRVAASQVVFYYGNNIVRSTLTAAQQDELAHQHWASSNAAISPPQEIQLQDEQFLSTSLILNGVRNAGQAGAVRLTVLKSYDQATAFIGRLNRLLLALGLAAVVIGSLLVFLISHTFTRPFGSLVAGVRALEKGDFDYSLDDRGKDEVAELTRAFDRMRISLKKTQQELLEAERLATIGRMASSISHDLRHSLAAIVANAEFLCEVRLSSDQREELYQEVTVAVNQMTELIDSLLEFSRTRESLRPAFGNVKNSVEAAIKTTIRSHPEFHTVRIEVHEVGNSAGFFDQRKLQRALFNLLLNACEAVPASNGVIVITITEIMGGIEIRVSDNGRGIPDSVRATLFEPFVSQGKENGTGLGLTVVQKIIQDHGGEVEVERSNSEGTIFRVAIPLSKLPGDQSGYENQKQSFPQTLAPRKRTLP